jgi:DNA polymerase V
MPTDHRAALAKIKRFDQLIARSKRLMAALDAINDRWGDGTLRDAAGGITRAWSTRFHRRSPAYTTQWSDLPLVQA